MGRRLLGDNKELHCVNSSGKIFEKCFDNRVFRLKMTGGNESNSAGRRAEELMVRDISRDERFAAERERVGEKLAARSAAKGNSFYASAAVAVAHMTAESLRDKLGKILG